jgi:hypothetical protein
MRERKPLLLTVLVVSAFVILAAFPAAQWLNEPTPGIPRTKDGKPNLSAPVPKTRDGKPDLSGIWVSIPPQSRVDRSRPSTGDGVSNASTLEDLPFFNIENFLADGSVLSMTAEADALFKRRRQTFGAGRPSERCLPHGIPDAMLIPVQFKIVQGPGLTLILFEEFNHYRQIFTDGRRHPKDQNPTWLGYSIGTWDGDTFVVDSVGFNDQTWIDDHGHPHSDRMHTIERFRRRDFGHMDLELTVDDPKSYTKPWTAVIQLRLDADTELIEDLCDNEKDAAHSVKH